MHIFNVLALAADVAWKDGGPKVYARVVFGRFDGSARGGRFRDARVRPMLGGVLIESLVDLRKQIDEQSGLAPISL